MPRKFANLILLLAFGLSAAALAGPPQHRANEHKAIDLKPYKMSARQLKIFCSGVNDIDMGYCAGYIAAMAEIMLDTRLYDRKACHHGPVRDQQLIEIVRDFLDRHPDYLRRPSAELIAHALADAFPCDERSAPEFPETQYID